LNRRGRTCSIEDVEIQRGTVGDQPWGLTLGALSQRAATGELTIVDGPLRIVLAIESGRLVGATSTMRAGSLLERATRTFELVRGTYSLTDEVTLRRDRNDAIDLRAIVFAGARKYLPDDRLTGEIRQLGSRFTLTGVGVEELPHYDLEVPQTVIDALRDGATLAELEARHVDGRAVRAAIYALVCCGSARGLLPARAPTPPPASRTTTPGRTPTPPGSGRAPTPPGAARAPTPPGAARTPTPPGSARTITPDTARTATTPDTPRTIAAAAADAPRTPDAPRTSTANDSGSVLARIPTVNVGRSPSPPGARTTTPSSSRATTDDVQSRVPTTRDRPPLPGDRPPLPSPDLDPDTIREQRAATAASLGRTRTRATPFQTGDTGPLAASAAARAREHLDANEPELAVREAAAAMLLVPESLDYQALHAWATFCAAKDKPAAADEARTILEKASQRAEAPHEVRLLLGRLERAVGREREALRHFRAVLERVPDHARAAAELRELEEQIASFERR
jgi:hypothetical protein